MTPFNHTPLPGGLCFCGHLICPDCQQDPDWDTYHDASYQAGYDHCTADGYDDRPMTEWIYRTACRTEWIGGRIEYHMTPIRFAELSWRRAHASASAYRRWFEREYGYDLEDYLQGYDDAGAGLPSAVGEPEVYAVCAARLDAYESVSVDALTTL